MLWNCSGIPDKLGEVSPYPSTGDHVSGASSEVHKYVPLLPLQKTLDFCKGIQTMLNQSEVSVRQLAHFVGKINSTILYSNPSSSITFQGTPKSEISHSIGGGYYETLTTLSAAVRKDLHEGQMQCPCTTPTGQHHCSGIYKSQGSHTLPSTETTSEDTMGLVFPTPNPDLGSPPPGNLQRRG